MWIEDESIAIGKIFLPEILWRRKKESPVVRIEIDKSIRIDRLVNEYGPADRGEFLQAMEKITKKLGGQHFNHAKELLEAGDMHGTIDILLTYYDKAYMNSLEKKLNQVLGTVTWNGTNPGSAMPELLAFSRQAARTLNN